jgi:hypothetical protein
MALPETPQLRALRKELALCVKITDDDDAAAAAADDDAADDAADDDTYSVDNEYDDDFETDTVADGTAKKADKNRDGGDGGGDGDGDGGGDGGDKDGDNEVEIDDGALTAAFEKGTTVSAEARAYAASSFDDLWRRRTRQRLTRSIKVRFAFQVARQTSGLR